METIIQTKQGAVEGVRSGDGQTVIFRGIPYAEAPVGALRFRRAQEKKPWDGVRPCKEFGPRCPQTDLASMDFYGKEFYDDMVPPCGEDCLYLNIWAPAESDGPLPVLFWIHGGAFMHGCGSEKEFDGEGFAKKGVIMVSVNYRVNVFGFFAHPELEKENAEGVSGNYGILDQIFALQWVRENISAFGGDPARITLCGQSAGCMSVHTIISSPLTKGMAAGAILQSGTGLPPRRSVPSREQAQDAARALMEYLHTATIDELRRVPAEDLMHAAYAVQDKGFGWRPHIDNWLINGQVDDLAESGAIHDIRYMIGCTGGDIGNGAMREGTAAWCENLLKLGRQPGWLYFFNRDLPGDDAGSFHSSELWYVFETLPRCWRPWEEHDYEISRAMSACWANFVKTGDPNGPGLPRWEPYAEGHKAPMEFK